MTRVPCVWCKGTGWVMGQLLCRTCHGTGWVDAGSPRLTAVGDKPVTWGLTALALLPFLVACPDTSCLNMAAVVRPGDALICHAGAALSVERTDSGLDLAVCTCPGKAAKP